MQLSTIMTKLSLLGNQTKLPQHPEAVQFVENQSDIHLKALARLTKQVPPGITTKRQ